MLVQDSNYRTRIKDRNKTAVFVDSFGKSLPIMEVLRGRTSLVRSVAFSSRFQWPVLSHSDQQLRLGSSACRASHRVYPQDMVDGLEEITTSTWLKQPNDVPRCTFGLAAILAMEISFPCAVEEAEALFLPLVSIVPPIGLA